MDQKISNFSGRKIKLLAEDIIHNQKIRDDKIAYNYALYLISNILKKYGKSIVEIKELPEIDEHMLKSVTDVKYEPSQIEDKYDIDQLRELSIENALIAAKIFIRNI